MMKKEKKVENELKYRLHYLLRQLTAEEYEVAMKMLPERLGVSKATWKRWIYLRQNETPEMNGCHLLVLASFFEVTFEELFTEVPEKIDRKSFFAALL